jgi:Sec-independent protein translocase protein TatA
LLLLLLLSERTGNALMRAIGESREAEAEQAARAQMEQEMEEQQYQQQQQQQQQRSPPRVSSTHSSPSKSPKKLLSRFRRLFHSAQQPDSKLWPYRRMIQRLSELQPDDIGFLSVQFEEAMDSSVAFKAFIARWANRAELLEALLFLEENYAMHEGKRDRQ